MAIKFWKSEIKQKMQDNRIEEEWEEIKKNTWINHNRALKMI